ncbi:MULTISPECIES: lysophospholipid acyltransferase family protein [Desulfobacula]|uniref:Phospholipid/glycerol acetyltransferase n=2 Tax=Desulfobacula TaxID=28222 RepID=K0NSL6_DESTT|nr:MULTISPECIES: lysophospholipid acyltransferase family protein [Desulfobacula]CCK81992.1 phospholipid/glycerol acetyltransferase [Desulfobacula toluolica Tol2]SDU43459.1 1-acyl-sn-glycerol-3-phosphate acyltransferase [Desulfobacula phenolica]
MIFFKNLLFFILVSTFTIIFFLFFGIILIFIRVFSSKTIAQKTLRFLIVCYGRIIIFGFARILVKVKFIDSSEGKQALDPCVYVANHSSASDAFLMGVLPGEFVQIVNLWPFKIPILGLCARLAGYLSIRSMSFVDFSKECKLLFSNNISIIGFPEGTRSVSSQMGKFHSTLFRIAKENNLKIVPLCILGNKDKPLRGSLKINPGNIEIHKLPAIDYNEYEHFSSFELKNYTRAKMQIFIDQHKEVI